MKRSFFLVCMAMLFTSSMTLWANSPQQLIRIDGLTSEQVRDFANRGYEIAKAGPDFVECVVSRDERADLPVGKIAPKVLIPDLDAYVTGILAGQKRGAEYYMYDRLEATLNDWAAKYPSITRLVSIGRTCEGRDILAMKVSDNPGVDESEPSILIDGAHHAREWISYEVTMETLKQLLEGYGQNPRLTRMVNEREIWFVPVVNPDGVIFSQTQSRFWRKNRRQVDATNFGVDLNRNYGFQWGNAGAGTDPKSDTYRGSQAFSEPEALAIKGLAERERFQACLSFHSYSELVLYPFSYAKGVPCPDKSRFQVLGQEMAAFNHYQSQNSAELYAASGVQGDWLYTTFKTFAFTIEIGNVYIPPAEKIAELCALNIPAAFYLIEKAGTYGITAPGGNFAVGSLLDSGTAIDAIVDGTSILASLPENDRLESADRLREIGVRLAELTTQEMCSGNQKTWNLIKETPATAFVVPLIRDRLAFDRVHQAALK
ncbi:MAG: M14 family metallopeptidase [Candidatus Ozemobacteraceae bacterium]